MCFVRICIHMTCVMLVTGFWASDMLEYLVYIALVSNHTISPEQRRQIVNPPLRVINSPAQQRLPAPGTILAHLLGRGRFLHLDARRPRGLQKAELWTCKGTALRFKACSTPYSFAHIYIYTHTHIHRTSIVYSLMCYI